MVGTKVCGYVGFVQTGRTTRMAEGGGLQASVSKFDQACAASLSMILL